MDVFSVFSLIGGLALFLYGMNFMGDSLKKLSGGQLESILGKLTSNRFKGFLLGFIVTSVIQSSSATTVMLVGFVNSGIMRLSQTISIIMGANIGTTVTAWILSLSGLSGDSFFIKLFKPSTFTPILAFVGFIISVTAKKDSKRDVGYILIGFAILMYGMEAMSGSMSGLKDSEIFRQVLVMFKNPIMGILSGTLLTAIIQSSSASIGILQALSITGAIPASVALPIILGQNIGTTITPVLSSINGNTGAKRVAVSCVYIKLIGVIIISTVFYILHGIFGFSFMDSNVTVLSIAVIHTAFNVISTVILLPFCGAIEKLSDITVKGTNGAVEDEFSTLDERFLSLPQFAIEKCRELVCRMTLISKDTFCMSLEMMTNYDKSAAEIIRENENRVDLFEDKIGTYLVKLAKQKLSENDSNEVSKYLHIIGDIERISDHAVNILEVSDEIYSKKINFSENARHEISVMSEAVSEILELSFTALANQDLMTAKKIEPLEQIIDKLKMKMKNNHIQRLQSGKCTIEQGFVLTDFITNCERVSDHCSNIAVCLLEMANNSFETHEYLHQVKENGENSFFEQYDKYKKKYRV